MLHDKLELEKNDNYPIIRTILCANYGPQFKAAKITAIPEGQESYCFIADLGNGEEYFFKIERFKIKSSAARKQRLEAICQFMTYLHDQHLVDPANINSAKILRADNGEYIPLLSETASGIPSDLIGHEISLATRINGKPLSTMLSAQPLNPFNWTSYALGVIPMMASTITNFQKAGEKFSRLHPELGAILNGEGGRTIPRDFNVVQEDIKSALTVSKEELKQHLVAKIVMVYGLLELSLPTDLNALSRNIEKLQEMYALALKTKGCADFNAKTFTACFRKYAEAEQYGEPLAKIGRFIHQLNECLTLCSWLENGTATAVAIDLAKFEQDYKIVCQLPRAKLAHQDTNATNYMVETNKADRQNVSLIDIFLFLSSGLRTYDLAVNLRNACAPTNNEQVDKSIAKAMVQKFDESLRLTHHEVYSLWRLFKAVEIGNALHGIAALMVRAANIKYLGTGPYDATIHTQFTLDSKKKVVDLDSKRIMHHDMQAIVAEGREQTVDALCLEFQKTFISRKPVSSCKNDDRSAHHARRRSFSM